MDLNYLYQRHQVSLFRAERASCENARRAHLELADSYDEQIRAIKAPARTSRG